MVRNNSIDQTIARLHLEKVLEAANAFTTNDKKVMKKYLIVRDIPDFFVARYGSFPQRIYIRKCYKDLYELAVQSIVGMRNHFGVTVFTGVPGIGKSLFLLYCIFRFRRDARFENKRFAVEFDAGTYYVFEATEDENVFLMEYIADGGRLTSRDFLLLCDITLPVEPLARAKATLIFSGPNPQRYRCIAQNDPSFVYTMPTWTRRELKYVNWNVERWHHRFETFGGVPRLIFANKYFGEILDDESPYETLDLALENHGRLVAEALLGDTVGLGALVHEDCFILVHINPPQHSEKIHYGSSPEYSVASDEIFKSLALIHNYSLVKMSQSY